MTVLVVLPVTVTVVPSQTTLVLADSVGASGKVMANTVTLAVLEQAPVTPVTEIVVFDVTLPRMSGLVVELSLHV